MSLVMRKPVLPYAKNKGADQPAQMRRLISTFVIRCLDFKFPYPKFEASSLSLLLSRQV